MLKWHIAVVVTNHFLCILILLVALLVGFLMVYFSHSAVEAIQFRCDDGVSEDGRIF